MFKNHKLFVFLHKYVLSLIKIFFLYKKIIKKLKILSCHYKYNYNFSNTISFYSQQRLINMELKPKIKVSLNFKI